MNNYFALPDLGTICTDAVPTVLGILDPTIAPQFLYYAYVPITVLALFFGLAVFLSNSSTLTRLFFWITVVFSMLVLSELLLWITAPIYLIHFIWELTALWHVLLMYLVSHFIYHMVRGHEMPFFIHAGLVAVLLPIVALTSTNFNLAGFDIALCESVQGSLWYYIYFVEAVLATVCLSFCIQVYMRSPQGNRHLLILGAGTTLFWIILIASNLIGDVTLVHDLNLLGPLGMVVLISTLSYMIVRYHVFNLRVIGAQALVIAVLAALFAALFVRTIESAYIILVGTFIAVASLGTLLIRAVKREVQQRVFIETQRAQLEVANKLQENLLHFISHEIKGFLTDGQNAFAGIVEGDFGETPPPLKKVAMTALGKMRQGVDTVMNILDASNLKKGMVTYTKAPFNFTESLTRAIETMRAQVVAKGLELSSDVANGILTVDGDRQKIEHHIIRNLIDNAIRYTLGGSIHISLKQGGRGLVFSVRDTGVGISEEDHARLFTEGGHGKESIKVNVDSTGYGLFIAKQVVEAHGGVISAVSEGAGKGSTFIVELPVVA